MIQKLTRYICMAPILGLLLVSGLVYAITASRLEEIKQIETPKFVTQADRERQLTCLARNIYFEAASEPFEGKVAVAQVTLNRTESADFPSDICAVVYQKNQFITKTVCQFSWYCEKPSSLKIRSPQMYTESYEVAKKVLLEGFRLNSLKQAMYYHADYVNPGWKRDRIIKIGRHIFYEG